MPYGKCSNGSEHRWLADAGVSGMFWCSHCGKRVWEKSELGVFNTPTQTERDAALKDMAEFDGST